ncbi:MAG: DUF4837 family protein [Bacteroidetes bacterium]|nr:DUF4837 family protein [Bacteroidota bacterium]
MSLLRHRLQLAIGFSTIILHLLNSGCNSSDTSRRDSSIGTAARITVFYPDFFEDSANEIFTQTHWAVDSNLIRFEEKLDKSNDAYYEAQFEFELHNFSQMEEDDIATHNKMQSAPLVWIIDPKSKFDDIAQSADSKNPDAKKTRKDTTINNIQCTWISNVWSVPQVVLIIRDSHSDGGNIKSSWFQANQKTLFTITKQFELGNTTVTKTESRHPSLVQNRYSDSISAAIEANYALKVILSAELKLVAKANDFLWLRQETGNYHINLMLQFIAGSDSLVDQISARNTLTKKYLKTAERTWVEISESGQFPIRKWKTNGLYGQEYWMSGWQTELNTNRCGPFLRRVIRDTINHRYVAVDGFIFAPNQPRNRMMRELEIMVSQFSLSQ